MRGADVPRRAGAGKAEGQGQAGGAAGPQPDGQDAKEEDKGKDDVIDAEFEVKK